MSCKVSFIGLGVMGYPMAGYISKAGHNVTVYNRTKAKAEKWAKEYKGNVADTPMDAAKDSDFIFTCVGNDNDLREVTLGDKGLFKTAKKGSIYIDNTTASANIARELYKEAKAKGFDFLDAPISGGQAGAEGGILNYSLFVVLLLFASSLFFSFINSIYLLAIGIFLMRFSGQGLMSHTSTTTISRFFERSRGKALSTIWFGLSTAEFILPVLITYFFLIYSWRTVWQGIAILIILFLPFVILNTIKSIKLDSREADPNPGNKKIKIKSWKRRDVLKDYRFYIVSLNMLAMPWIATGVFVYQSFISDSKMWAVQN